jgi:hypothetical protein
MSSDVKREPINPVAPVNKIRIGFLGIRDPEYCHQNWGFSFGIAVVAGPW